MTLIDRMKQTKQASHALALLSEEKKNDVLRTLAATLRSACANILQENAKDLALMDKANPMYDRLLLNESRVHGIAADIENVVSLASPVFRELEQRTMPNGLSIKKVCVPLGVIGVIYEARPNVTVDVFTLCFKTGNACILKGGKDAHHSSSIFVRLIQNVLREHGIDEHSVLLFPPSREDTALLLHANGLVDVCIPRGSQALIEFVRKNASIPVIETGAGIVHVYFDASGDLQKGSAIVNNSKTRRVSVCNALDCLVVHKDRLDDIPALVEPMQPHQVEIFADAAAYSVLEGKYPAGLLHHAAEEDFGKEFLSYKMALKVVDSLDDAIAHVVAHTSGHSESIVTEDEGVARYYVDRIDAAAVYVNAPTSFTDGAQFGLGAEIGISTQKLHARGPMGLEALTSYKWVVHGNGQVRE